MKLTIGMIVKNEEKYLERCLTAIKPILDNVDSELIITDTGSTDRTVEIAKKFTDNVVFYEWTKDFAAARNVALKAAKGEWFMFLDADEIFESCNGIIDFFNSGRYTKYNFATYIIRNLLNLDGEYNDAYAYRMAKILPETKFIGMIHEHIVPIKPTLYDIGDIAVHYGYLYDNSDEEAKKRKAARNLELLLKEEQNFNDKDNPLLYSQIFDCYSLINDNENAELYLKKGMYSCLRNNSKYIAVYYNKKAIIELRDEKIHESLDTIDEYLCIGPPIRDGALTTDMEMYALKATILYDHLNYVFAKDAFVNFFRLFDDVKSGRLDTEDASALAISVANNRNYTRHVSNFIDCCCVCNDLDTAVEYLTTLPICKYSEKKEFADILLEREMTVLNKTGFEKAYECYRQLDDYGKDGFISRLIRELYRSEHMHPIIAAMRKIGDEIPWLKDKSDIYDAYISDSDMDKDIIAGFIKKYGIQDHIDLVKIVLEKGIDLSCILEDKSVDLKALAFACCRYLDSFYQSAASYDLNCISSPDSLEKAAEFYKYIMETALIGDDTTKKNVEQLMLRFADTGDLYASKSGRSEAEMPEILQSAVIAGNAVRFKNEKKYRECVAEIKRAIAVYQPIAAVMAEYSKIILAEYEEASKAAQPKSEMEMLAAAIKKNIRAYIAAGNLDAARKTLAEYKTIAPNDPDIEMLMKELEQ